MPYVFVHGLGQNASSWERTLSCLALREPADCPELSALLQDGEVSYGHLYSAFSAHCEGLSQPVDLCGLSLGAVLALQYAIQRPEGVRSLALIAPQYRMPKALLKIQNVVFHFMPEKAFQSTGFHKAAFMELTRSMMDIDLSAGLRRVTCPTLVLCGTKDSANRKAGRQLAEGISSARLQWIENAGHEVNLEAPEALAERLKRFYVEEGGTYDEKTNVP